MSVGDKMFASCIRILFVFVCVCVSLLGVSCVSVGSRPLRSDMTLEANKADEMLVL